jgi:hypothetical protein
MVVEELLGDGLGFPGALLLFRDRQCGLTLKSWLVSLFLACGS